MSKHVYDAVVLRTGYRQHTIRIESNLPPSRELLDDILHEAHNTVFGSEHSSEYEVDSLFDETGKPVVIPPAAASNATDRPLSPDEIMVRLMDEIMGAVAPLEKAEISQSQLVLETVKRVLSVIWCGTNTTPPCAVAPLGTPDYDLRLDAGQYWPRNYDMMEAASERGCVEIPIKSVPTFTLQDALWAALARRERNTKAQA